MKVEWKVEDYHHAGAVTSGPGGTYEMPYVLFEGEDPNMKMLHKTLTCHRRIQLDQETFDFPTSPGQHIGVHSIVFPKGYIIDQHNWEFTENSLKLLHYGALSSGPGGVKSGWFGRYINLPDNAQFDGHADVRSNIDMRGYTDTTILGFTQCASHELLKG
eukprot:gene5243-13707_t